MLTLRGKHYLGMDPNQRQSLCMEEVPMVTLEPLDAAVAEVRHGLEFLVL